MLHIFPERCFRPVYFIYVFVCGRYHAFPPLFKFFRTLSKSCPVMIGRTLVWTWVSLWESLFSSFDCWGTFEGRPDDARLDATDCSVTHIFTWGLCIVEHVCFLAHFLILNLAMVIWYHTLDFLSGIRVVLWSRFAEPRLCLPLLNQEVNVRYFLGLDSCFALGWPSDILLAGCLPPLGENHLRISTAPCASRRLAFSKYTLICWVCTFNHWRISNPLACGYWFNGFWKHCWYCSGSVWPCLYRPLILASRSDLVGSSPCRCRHSFLCSHRWYT